MPTIVGDRGGVEAMTVYQGMYGSMMVETRDGWQAMPIGSNGYVDLSGTISAMPSGDYGGDYIATYAIDSEGE